MNSSTCQHCHRSVSTDQQMYQMDDLIVCETCAGVTAAESESELAAAVVARGTSRRRHAVKPKPKSMFSAAAISFAAVTILVAGGMAYFTWNGALTQTLNDQRKALDGTDAHNALIDQYNGLVADGNKLATDHKYAAASQKLREARAVAQATPKVKEAVDVARLETVIAYYDALAAGKSAIAPSKSPAPGADVAPATPDNVRFMDKGKVEAPSVSKLPAFEVEPDPAVAEINPATAGATKAEAERQAKQRQIDAYKVPK